MFFRPDLESPLQPMNSSSRKRLSRRRREVSGHVEDQAKSPTGLGPEATPHGWRSAQSTSARRRRAGLCSRFPGFQSAGWAYPYVSWHQCRDDVQLYFCCYERSTPSETRVLTSVPRNTKTPEI